MNYVLDAIVLVILIFFIYGGIRRGGVRSLIGLVCAVAAVWGASSLSTVISQGFYSAFLENSLHQQVSAVLQGAAGEDLTGGKDFGVFAGAPFLYFGQRRF